MRKRSIIYDFKFVKDDDGGRIDIIPVFASGPNGIESRLETMTAGSIARLVRLAKGRAQASDLWAARETASRTGSIWQEIFFWLQSPVDEVRDFVIDTLQDARRQVRRRRKSRPPMLAVLSLRLAIAEVASVIMRHGPPLAHVGSGPRPG